MSTNLNIMNNAYEAQEQTLLTFTSDILIEFITMQNIINCELFRGETFQ